MSRSLASNVVIVAVVSGSRWGHGPAWIWFEQFWFAFVHPRQAKIARCRPSVLVRNEKGNQLYHHILYCLDVSGLCPLLYHIISKYKTCRWRENNQQRNSPVRLQNIYTFHTEETSTIQSYIRSHVDEDVRTYYFNARTHVLVLSSCLTWL